MLKAVDNFLNKITMYRLILYYLIALVVAAAIVASFGALPYGPVDILASTLFLVAVCWLVNKIFAKTFEVPANVESLYITALILALIINPASSLSGYAFLFWAGAIAMASKYILALHKKHIFNPAAIAVVITALALNQSASWWISSIWICPIVFIGGLLMVRKIKRFDLVFSFIFVSLLTSFVLSIFKGSDVALVMKEAVLHAPLLFFAFVMLTEPLTTPPTKNLQIWYGALVGFLFAPQVHFGGFYTTPELALAIGNVFAYIVSPKQKLLLKLRQKIQLAPDVYDFVFHLDRQFAFAPGQYLEWTLGHHKVDTRGNRRYFTISSAPTEKELRMGVKFYENPSTFKQALIQMPVGQNILAGQLAGDFTLPKDHGEKLVFIAGGIGITPFRSMIKYLLDTNQRRPITMFYANKTAEEAVYQDVFEQAEEQLGIRTVHVLSQQKDPAEFPFYAGRITPALIKKEVPDYKQRTFYLSGPRSMVVAFEDALKQIGVHRRNIKTDFFPGFV